MSAKNKLITFFRILILIAACILATVVLVFPLWKFAVTVPKVYTAIVLILLALFIAFLIARKIIAAIKTRKNK